MSGSHELLLGFIHWLNLLLVMLGCKAQHAMIVRHIYFWAKQAVTNLHQTKVGDGDLVEERSFFKRQISVHLVRHGCYICVVGERQECIVACHRWHSRSWSAKSSSRCAQP